MAASFPTTVKTFTAKTDGVDYPQAAHVNDLQDEVNAIETDIGTTAAGGANLFKRINNLTVDSTPDRSADYVGTYDASASTGKKVLLQDVGGYPLHAYFGAGLSPADATTYYFGWFQSAGLPTSETGTTRIYIPRSGVLRKVYFTSNPFTTGTSETSTFSIRLNGTTDTTITSTAAFNTAPFTASNTSMSVTLSSGDYITIKWVTPTWVTNPTNITMMATFWIA